MRILAIIAGAILLGTSTWTVIEDAHLTGPHAALVGAMAVGTAAGAIVAARTTLRVGVFVFLAVLCGESFGMVATAERVILRRETAAIQAASTSPAARLALERQRDAVAALKEHDAMAVTAIARRDCGKECRGLLDRTRATLAAERDEADRQLTAKAGLKSTPLADRLGVEPWKIDLVIAGLLSVGANGLACVLIAWGAHGPRRKVEHIPARPATDEKLAPQSDPKVIQMRRKATAKDAARFGVAHLRPGDGDVPLKSIAEAFWRWCEREGLTAPDIGATMTHLVALLGRAGVETEMTPGREVVARGVQLKSEAA